MNTKEIKKYVIMKQLNIFVAQYTIVRSVPTLKKQNKETRSAHAHTRDVR